MNNLMLRNVAGHLCNYSTSAAAAAAASSFYDLTEVGADGPLHSSCTKPLAAILAAAAAAPAAARCSHASRQECVDTACVTTCSQLFLLMLITRYLSILKKTNKKMSILGTAIEQWPPFRRRPVPAAENMTPPSRTLLALPRRAGGVFRIPWDGCLRAERRL